MYKRQAYSRLENPTRQELERTMAILEGGIKGFAFSSGQAEMCIRDSDEEKYIIAADDLAPSETIQLERERVLAFVTRQGSTNSHTAILAITMNIRHWYQRQFQKE